MNYLQRLVVASKDIRYWFLGGILILSSCTLGPSSAGHSPGEDNFYDNSCQVKGKVKRIVEVDMVALNQPFYFNRLGAAQLDGLIFALASDVVLMSADGTPLTESLAWRNSNYEALVGNVTLRPDKRPRPIVLRANVNDCLNITFTNLIQPQGDEGEGSPTELATDWASVHIQGTEYFSRSGYENTAIENDGAFIGKNPNNLAAPGERKHYSLFVPAEGGFILNSTADNSSNFQAGQMTYGLFGSLNVQPEGAEYYRSQVSKDILAKAATGETKDGQPLINYQATYTSGYMSGKPILNMLQSIGDKKAQRFSLIYSDPTAIITGPNAGRLAAKQAEVPQYPNRQQPYREFNIMYHEATQLQQAFSEFVKGQPLENTLNAGGDFFAINYGSAAIGPEIWSNRIGVGPMANCISCQYEEFFLSSWVVGDPAMVVDVPANFSASMPAPNDVPRPHLIEEPDREAPGAGAKATKAFYPDDPSNVYHSYMRDHVKMRIHHGAGTLHHLHHLHAHQWLHSPNNDDGHYLDSQLIGPGSSFTLDMVYNGSGNRNHTVGDSIFHCHFYPHFAEGMWSMWRVHDVFEAGTKLDVSGRPAIGSRALPDGEIAVGTPIPGLVPLPTIAMAPMPSPVHINKGQVVFGTTDKPDTGGQQVTKNPGYPFFIPGIAGERPPHPPLDFAELNGEVLDGGLPRHIVEPDDGSNYKDATIVEYHNRFDFSKFSDTYVGKQLPEEGTPVEKVAMAAHAVRDNSSYTPENQVSNFVLNGLPPQPGAPYADPCMLDSGNPVATAQNPRRYRGVDMQMDVVLNKEGWHYSQQRMGVLWQDLIPTLTKERPPEPLFFRANSNDCIEYWLANVVPEYYELDDFQVRTPTDILGQHIHLVKFDVTSSDGGANGWNYEDGTFSNEAVQSRIDALNKGGLEGLDGKVVENGLTAVAPNWLCDGLSGEQEALCLENAKEEWLGAQATVQRWYADPQLNNAGKDRTLRTVFTHDHFGPSTHQQAGLYMGLLVEPEGSSWEDSETGVAMNTRNDGGPTSWQAVINTQPGSDSYREFALEFQDFQLAYTAGSPEPVSCKKTPDSFVCYPEENETSYYGKNKPAYQETSEKNLNSICFGGSNACKSEDKIWTPNAFNWPDGSSSSSGGSDYVTAIQTETNGYSGYLSPEHVINPPQLQAGEAVTPTLVSTTPPFALGTYSVNYRNEPTPFRVSKSDGASASNEQGDLAHVFRSIERARPSQNSRPKIKTDIGKRRYQPPLTAGVYPYDPYTPLLRAFEGDNVQVRTLVGAHINMHNFSMQGLRWLFEPSNDVSGYRSNQPMGISEHFEMMFQVPPATMTKVTAEAGGGVPSKRTACASSFPVSAQSADFFYNPTSEANGLVNGNWGLLRSYAQGQKDLCLQALANKPRASKPIEAPVCPLGAPQRKYNVIAVTGDQLPWQAADNTQGTGLMYNFKAGILDENGLVYFACDATSSDNCKPHIPLQTESPRVRIEPMVLRAAAGECITVRLTNNFSADSKAFEPEAVSNPGNQNALLQFNGIEFTASEQVALAPQLVSYDINQSNGVNLGFNKVQTAKIGETVTYTWYAGIRERVTDKELVVEEVIDEELVVEKVSVEELVVEKVSVEELVVAGVRYTPAEFGTTNLLPSDSLQQSRYGVLAGLVIEPAGSRWNVADTGTSNTIIKEDGSRFEEFVLMAQDSYQFAKFQTGFNYASEPLGASDFGGRYAGTGSVDIACSFANELGNINNNATTPYAALGDPETPVFYADAGAAVRFRVMQPSGADQHVFGLFGHVWQEEPYLPGSTVIGNNPASQWQGSRMGLSAADRFDIVIPSAGGEFAVPGDYLYNSYIGGDQNYGMWGIFRVGHSAGSTSKNRAICNPAQYSEAG